MKDSKEGLNGNVVVDETHVVDRDFMDILKYAGASRPQALELKFSTAGSNPEGYGKEEWDKGEKVVSGELAVDNFFHQSYHAPQTLTPEQFREDPEKFILSSNPAIGHTVGMEELKPAGLEAMQSPADFAESAMYRLNVWQHAAQTWLGTGVWESCAANLRLSDYEEGTPFGLGLDHARKFDLAACVPSTPNKLDSVDILVPMFWCNEERILQLATKYPKILEWVRDGFIKELPGNVNDMRVIKNDIRRFCQQHNVVGIVYDATYAETMIQELTEGDIDANGKELVAGLPIGEQAMSQGSLTQTGPVADFENDLKAKKKVKH